MGNYVNKFFSHDNVQEIERTKTQSCVQEASVEENNMCTPPVTHRKLPMDPRSVTIGIDRTPIEVNCTPVGPSKRISAIPRHLQRPYLETDIDKVMPQLTPKKRFGPKITESTQIRNSILTENAETYLTPTVNIIRCPKMITPIDKERYEILGLDPRSPAADFDRTPILMPRSIERIKARSQENLNRRGSYETDIYYSRFSYCETSSQFSIPEIQALPDMAMNAIKSLNLDNAHSNDRLNKSDSSCCSHNSKIEIASKSSNEITIIENPKLNYIKYIKEEPTSSLCLTDEEMSEEEKHEDENEVEINTEQSIPSDLYFKCYMQQNQVCSNDNEKIKIWRDSLSSEEPEEIRQIEFVELNKKDVKEAAPQIPKEEVIITFDDDSIAKDTLSLKLANTEIGCQKKQEVPGKKKKIFKPDIKITTDEKRVLNSDNRSANDSSKTRTPLGNRSNNGQMQTLLPKSPQQLFRNKGIMPALLQENTPPHKRCIAKSKLSGIQWDPDSTVII